MSYKIAIYDTPNDAILAIQALEQAGFVKTDLTVIAKNRENTRRIENETDVDADELQDLTDTRQAADQHGLDDPRVVAPIAASPGLTMTGPFTGGMAYPGNSFVAAAAFLDDDDSMDSALHDLGVPGGDVEPCREAIARGGIIVAAEIGSDASNGGPDLTRGGEAEAVFRSTGATRIL
ncbi:general stress protein [Paenibacillus sp. GCM10023250]|uniref:general stress protein n=1 Tax=Paenibacillus sp. GCM10023250 TaxID=3252648 RepID=UPI0036099A53